MFDKMSESILGTPQTIHQGEQKKNVKLRRKLSMSRDFYFRCVACNYKLATDQHCKTGLCGNCQSESNDSANPDHLLGDLVEMEYLMWKNPMGGEIFEEDADKEYNGE